MKEEKSCTLKASRLVLIAGAMLLLMGLPFSVLAQGLEDSDHVDIRVEVAGALNVTSMDDNLIDLGILFPSMVVEVQADGEGPDGDFFSPAGFSITGPAPLTWTVSIVRVEQVPAVGTLGIGAPGGPEICFNADDPSPDGCEPVVDDQVADHGGEGWAFVGYRVEVDANDEPGTIYVIEEAIVLTADASLN